MFTKALIISGLAALATAQSTVLGFSHVPNPVVDGTETALTYFTNDTSSPVTIILRKGAATDLQTVSTLTTTATGGQYIWTPPASLANGNDYALEIVQGSQFNYYGPFVIQGAVGSAVSSASSSTLSANGTASTTVPVTPATWGSAVSAGTGTAMLSNSTVTMATLTASNSASSTAGSPSTASASSTGSSAASPSSSTTTNGASTVQMGTTLTLLFGAAAAVFCLQ